MKIADIGFKLQFAVQGLFLPPTSLEKGQGVGYYPKIGLLK